jgi:hypothetical protein
MWPKRTAKLTGIFLQHLVVEAPKQEKTLEKTSNPNPGLMHDR